jgi:uncharacterized protein YjbI with pentapeptide repeats
MRKIEIKNRFTGKIIFEFTKENNTIKDTILQFIKDELSKGKNYADLSSADLSSADLRYADLRYADLRYADLRYADLSSADLRYADLLYADLRYADLCYADLSSDDLRYADLRYADLLYADLRYADLRYADLSSADLSYADLSSADLSSADLDKKYISITRIGSSNRMTTYCFEDDVIWCGCFKGTLSEFEAKVNETHKDNELYLKQYLGAINYIKSLK